MKLLLTRELSRKESELPGRTSILGFKLFVRVEDKHREMSQDGKLQVYQVIWMDLPYLMLVTAVDIL